MSCTAPLPKIGVVSKATRILLLVRYPARRASSMERCSSGSFISCSTSLASNSCSALFWIGTSSISKPRATFQRRSYLVRSMASTKTYLVVSPQEQDADRQTGRYRRSPVVGTVQSGEVFIAEQMVSVLGQVSVQSVAADKIQIQMVSSK